MDSGIPGRDILKILVFFRNFGVTRSWRFGEEQYQSPSWTIRRGIVPASDLAGGRMDLLLLLLLLFLHGSRRRFWQAQTA